MFKRNKEDHVISKKPPPPPPLPPPPDLSVSPGLSATVSPRADLSPHTRVVSGTPASMSGRLTPPPVPIPNADYVSDPVSAIYAAAIELETSFVNALQGLGNLGSLKGEWEFIFKEVDHMREAGVEALLALRNAPQPLWLALVYGSQYQAVLHRFLVVNKDSLTRLQRLIATRQAEDAPRPVEEIEDVMWLCVSRVRHLSQLAKTQREAVIGNAALESALAFQTRGDRTGLFPGVAEECGCPAALLAVVDASIGKLQELATEAAMLAPLYGAVYTIRGIEAPASTFPPALGRKLVRQFLCSLYSPSEFGTCPSIPVMVFLFSDGMAVTMQRRPTRNYVHSLLEWYDYVMLQVTDTQAQSRQPTLHFGAKKVAYGSTALPPGWEEVPDKKDKKQTVFVFRALNITQPTRPPVAPLDGSMHLMCRDVEQKEALFAALRASLPQQGGSCELDLGRTPYCALGVPLESVLAHEKSCFYSARVPLLVLKSLQFLIARGLGEEGLLRIAGEKKRLEELRTLATTGRFFSYVPQGIPAVHDVTGLLKSFLRELPTPLIGPGVLPRFLAAIAAPDERQQLRLFAEAIRSMPPASADLLRELLLFLVCIVSNEHVNSMSSRNVAIVMVPNVIKEMGDVSSHMECIVSLIHRYAELFEGPCPPVPETPGNTWFSFRRKLLSMSEVRRTVLFGESVLSLDSEGILSVWSARDVTLTARVRWEQGVNEIIAVGKTLWVSSPAGIFVYSAPNELMYSIEGSWNVRHMLYIEKENEIWGACDEGIFVFDSRNGSFKFKVAVQGANVIYLASSPCGHVWGYAERDTSAGGVPDHDVILWTTEYKELCRLPPASRSKVSSVVVAGSNIWMGHEDGTLSMWDSASFECKYKLVAHKGPVKCMVALADQVLTGSSTEIRIWDLGTFSYIGEMHGYHTGPITSLIACAVTPSLTYVWSASGDQSLCVWTIHPHPIVYMGGGDRGMPRIPSGSLGTIDKSALN